MAVVAGAEVHYSLSAVYQPGIYMSRSGVWGGRKTLTVREVLEVGLKRRLGCYNRARRG